MVFGLFSRKPTASSAALADASTVDTSQHHHRVQQLRTPSPSIASGGSIGNPNNSPTQFITIRPHSRLGPDSPRPSDLAPLPPTTTDPTALHSLLLTIPPKILSDYILTQLNPSTEPDTDTQSPVCSLSPLTLTVLTSFFASISPPPLLHCARCHKGFFDVENDDRSCTVGHDDDSAEVERVGSSSRGVGAGLAGGYETLWGCCGKTVEGDGDMGPPDGWCYEGKHTTDTKRARFRADSTIHDDKLVSCHKLNCHGTPPHASDSGTSDGGGIRHTRKRPRKSLREESGSEEDSGIDEEVVSSAGKRKKALGRSASVGASVSGRSKKGTALKGKGKGKARAIDTDEDQDIEMDIANEDEPTSISTGPPKSKPKPTPKPKPKSTAKAKAPPTPGGAKKPISTRAVSATPRSSKPARGAKSALLAKKFSEVEVGDSEVEREREVGYDEKPRKKRKVS